MKKLILSIAAFASLMSAQASVFLYSVNFSDVGESLPSPGATGTGTVSYNDVTHSLTLTATFSGLLGNVTATHIHVSPTPGTGSGGIGVGNPSLLGFPTGVSSGSYGNTLDLTLTSTFNATYLANNGGTAASAEAAFAAHMAAGRAYWNIHSTYAGGGEIRGFLTAVPEPSSLAMLGLGAAVVAVRSRKSFRK